jgi:hypothetical protein
MGQARKPGRVRPNQFWEPRSVLRCRLLQLLLWYTTNRDAVPRSKLNGAVLAVPRPLDLIDKTLASAPKSLRAGLSPAFLPQLQDEILWMTG